MALTGEQYEALTRALASAFPTANDLDQVVQFKLGTPLNRITENVPHETLVLRTIRWAEARGPKLTDLIVGALNQNPDNPDLQLVAQQFGLDEGAGRFERIVIETVPLTDVEQWRAQMMRCERAVCRVEISGSGVGTGFLVGKRTVVTNYHVVEDVINGAFRPADVVLRFDYKLKQDGNNVQKGKEYRLAAGAQWLIASSPKPEDKQDKNLDYALLRVAGSPATDSVASQPGAPQREFLSPQAYEPRQGDPLFIIQHPKATPLKFAPGSVGDTKVAVNRIAHTVNTEEGSSGSPCFTSDWTPVALHHWGGKDHNRGVMFSAILKSWEEKNVMSEVGS